MTYARLGRRYLRRHRTAQLGMAPHLVHEQEMFTAAAPTTTDYLRLIGVPSLAPALCPFDPGYDLHTLLGHLQQSARLMALLKVSMACWIVGDEAVARAKVRGAHEYGVPVTAGGGPFEVAVAQGRLPDYLDLCADVGFDRVEAGQGFTSSELDPGAVVEQAHARGLSVQYELGDKHSGPFDSDGLQAMITRGRGWLEAGAAELVIEARESACGVGLFDDSGGLNRRFADQLVQVFGIESLMFEAPTKPSQFALLDHLGPRVRLCNVRLEEILRVEIYRRGLHSDAFGKPLLTPARLQRG
jgi:phosphosulfolactate synthase